MRWHKAMSITWNHKRILDLSQFIIIFRRKQPFNMLFFSFRAVYSKNANCRCKFLVWEEQARKFQKRHGNIVFQFMLSYWPLEKVYFACFCTGAVSQLIFWISILLFKYRLKNWFILQFFRAQNSANNLLEVSSAHWEYFILFIIRDPLLQPASVWFFTCMPVFNTNTIWALSMYFLGTFS